MFDFRESLQEEFAMGIQAWKLELIFASRIHQTSSQEEQIHANCLQSGRRPRWWKAETFEPTDQIVGQENQMEVRLIGREAVGRDLVQRKTLFELPNVQFAPASLGVKAPHRWSAQGEIAHQSMVVIILELPQCTLQVLILVLRLGSANHGELMGLVPLAGLIDKSGRLPASRLVKSSITQRLDTLFDGLGHIGHDRVTDSLPVERFDELVIVESGIRPQANPIKIFGNLLVTLFPEFESPGGGVRIARAQDAMPTVPRRTMKAQQRMITGSSPLLGIVPNVGFLDLPAIQRKNRRIQIEDQAAGRSGQIEHLLPQHIVDTLQPFDFWHTQTVQEFPQSRSVRKVAQPQQILKVSVVRKDSSIRNSSHPSDHDINHGHDDFRWMIMIAAAIPAHLSLQQQLQIQFSTKPLKKKHSTVVGETRILEGKFDFLQAFSHVEQSSLLVRFVRQPVLQSYYTQTPSILTKLSRQIYGVLRLIQVNLWGIAKNASSFYRMIVS